MNQSCLCTTLYSGKTFRALHQAAWIASYSADVTVNRLREFDPIGDRYVRVLADDTTAFHGQERELAFQRGGFQDVSHTRPPFFSATGAGTCG